MNHEELKRIVIALYGLLEPRLHWSIGALNLIREARLEDDKLHLEIALIADTEEELGPFRDQVFAALAPLGYHEIELELSRYHVALHGLEGVKRILMVGSGKGGVGKSAIAVNLAKSLQMRGLKVGLMDADIHGPSQPILLGNHNRPQVLAEEMLLPIEAHGLKFLSTGSLVPEDRALAWRGQLVSGTLLQFIRKTAWGELDYLIIDLPPGTGEVQLTIAKELKVDGVILVSMPQQVVLGDVRRAVSLYREKEIPLLGLVNNMTAYMCEKCGHWQEVFPAVEYDLGGIPKLLDLPLDKEFANAGNLGIPFVTEGKGPLKEGFEALVDHLQTLFEAQ